MRRLAIVLMFLVAVPSAAQISRHKISFEHATDCTANITGKDRQLCVDLDDGKIWRCEPSAGDCDTAAEWEIVQGPPETHCWQAADPATDDEWYSIWYAETAYTVTSIYCEVTGGTSVALDLEIDDGAITGVNGSNITCTTSGVLDATLGGDTAMAATNKMDVDMGTVTGAVTQVSVCFTMTRP